jgi:DNA-binding NtrC family response regulator
MRPRGKVLILDDEPIVGERLQPALEKLGFAVESFTESQMALERLAEEKFDVLVTDLKMHKPDGLDVLAFTKQHAPSTRVIIITGYATVETARQAMKGGAIDFIAKPFKISQLRDLILSITGDRQGA